jgi:hypothetical protein
MKLNKEDARLNAKIYSCFKNDLIKIKLNVEKDIFSKSDSDYLELQLKVLNEWQNLTLKNLRNDYKQRMEKEKAFLELKEAVTLAEKGWFNPPTFKDDCLKGLNFLIQTYEQLESISN